MIKIQKSDGIELDISEGSYVYFKDEAGKDIYKEWTELDYEKNSKLSMLVSKMDEILRKGTTLIK